jgi:hypothetical protein
VSKFREGDQIISRGPFGSGLKGTVVRTPDTSRYGDYVVEFPDETAGHDGDMGDDAKNRWYMLPEYMEAVPTKRKTPKGKQAYKGNGKHHWEYVTSTQVFEGEEVEGRPTWRLRVPGGWLYRYSLGGHSTFVPLTDASGYVI